MKPSLSAAEEINAGWHRCLGVEDIAIPNCPTDEQVAEIIERHMLPPVTE